MNAGAQWSADPVESGVGTLKLMLPNGGEYDLIANGAIRSGEIAALVEMRDLVLVQAQNQLDAIAAGLASAHVGPDDGWHAGHATGPQSGFEVDVGRLLAGNTHQSELFRHGDDAGAAASPSCGWMTLASCRWSPAAIGASGEVIGIDFSGGMDAVAAQLNAAFNGRFQFSNPSRRHAPGAGQWPRRYAQPTGLSARHTVTGLADGGA